MRLRFVIIACSVALGSSPSPASAQADYEVLRSLIEPAYPPVGRLLEASSGRLYGVAAVAGPASKGALLAYDRQPDGSLTSTIVHAFSGPDGATPEAGVIEGSDGALYGTTNQGGAEDRGTIYRIAPDGTFAVLHSFSASIGGYARTELFEAEDGHLYGNFSFYDFGPTGGIFRMTKAGVFSVVATGLRSEVALVDGGDGRFYGVSKEAPSGRGVVFSVTRDGVYSTLYSFTRPGPIMPLTLIDGRDGFFYGTTRDAFEDSRSTLFRISRTGVFSTVFTNPAPFTSAVDLDHLIRGSDGNFYGTTGYGGTAGEGAIYRVTPTGAFSTVHSFQYSFGASPNSLIQTRDGTFVGSTVLGGFSQRGVIFRSTTAGDYRVAHIFHGADPLSVSTLIAGPDGAIYGSSCGGGLLNAGTIFKLTSNATVLTVLHSFAYWDGYCPTGPIAFGADGALYGTAGRYGLGGAGTAFRLTTAGAFAVVRYFSGGTDGAWPTGLIRASDGNLYGTTQFNGPTNTGTIYRIGSTGFTTVHALERTAMWVGNPSVIQASDGHLYGVAPSRPFRMTLAGEITYFDPVPALFASLVEGVDGNLYGTTPRYLGQLPILPGTLFRMTPAGTTTVLHTFAATAEDPAPCAGMIAAPDGTLYGLGCSDSTGNFPGSIFAFSGTGPPVTIHVFDDARGSYPTAALMFAPDGALYGATLDGGQGGRGVIFRLRRP
jgi:uncharacterized repeat protein (TIGR03803 family)